MEYTDKHRQNADRSMGASCRGFTVCKSQGNHKALQSKQIPHLQVGPSQLFNRDLKEEMLTQRLRSVGSLFHSKEPEYFNDLSPNVVEFTLGCTALLLSRKL